MANVCFLKIQTPLKKKKKSPHFTEWETLTQKSKLVQVSQPSATETEFSPGADLAQK